ncbi:hypothetical protein [Flagellimonas sp.]|uniref:hypothetical protein n=1 Tax=Flagellimonas sp. TaxID=2058762 RepID=UPI003F49E8A9
MKRTALALLVFSFVLLTSCEEKDETFVIGEERIGPLLKQTPASDVESVFTKDSVVRDTSGPKLGEAFRKIKIFEKGGKHLLTLTPNQDSIPTIENIRVFDARYLTESGVGLQSTFKEIKANYGIKKIVTTLNSVVIFPKQSNLYFTLDKEDLPASLRYTTSSIEEVQIPDEAKIKYLMLGWD